MVPLQAIATRAQALRPDLDVTLSFLELSPPAPDEVIRTAAGGGLAKLYLAPLFLGQGAHARRDMTQLVERLKRQYPALQIQLLPAIGEYEAVLEAIATALTAAAR